MITISYSTDPEKTNDFLDSLEREETRLHGKRVADMNAYHDGYMKAIRDIRYKILKYDFEKDS